MEYRDVGARREGANDDQLWDTHIAEETLHNSTDAWEWLDLNVERDVFDDDDPDVVRQVAREKRDAFNTAKKQTRMALDHCELSNAAQQFLLANSMGQCPLSAPLLQAILSIPIVHTPMWGNIDDIFSSQPHLVEEIERLVHICHEVGWLHILHTVHDSLRGRQARINDTYLDSLRMKHRGVRQTKNIQMNFRMNCFLAVLQHYLDLPDYKAETPDEEGPLYLCFQTVHGG